VTGSRRPRPEARRESAGSSVSGGLSRTRRRTLAFLLIVVPIGFALKFWAGPGQWWINNWGASFAYEAFFMGLALLVLDSPRRIPAIAIGVCAGTVALEFLQLWKPPWLEAVRSTFVGRAVLGNAFSWSDVPAYPLGCLLGWLVLARLAAAPRDATDAGPR